MNSTPSRSARQAAGFSLESAAKRIARSSGTLRQWESSNRYPCHIAESLSRIYECPFDVFLPQRQVNIEASANQPTRRVAA